MNFIRKKIRGQKAETRKTWLSPEGYRIVWRNEACGISVPEGYQASVRVDLPNGEMWDRVEYGKPFYRTMKAAQMACEKHYKTWIKASQAGAREFKKLTSTTLGTPTFIN